MKRILWIVPLIALFVCSLASAQTRGVFSRAASYPIAADAYATDVMPVGFMHGGGPSCGAEPSCGAAMPSCGAEPSCGCGGEGMWDGYCGQKRCRKLHFGCLHRHKHSCGMETSCGCDAAPSCGCEVSAPSCGYDAAPMCNSCGHGCKLGHWGHRGGCSTCGDCCYRPCCGKFRFWANGWCGQVVDGYSCGNPPACMGESAIDVDGGKAMPQPAPMVEPEVAPAPAKSTRRPVTSPRFTSQPIGVGIR